MVRSGKARTIGKVMAGRGGGRKKQQKQIEQGKMAGKKFVQRETQRKTFMQKQGRILV